MGVVYYARIAAVGSEGDMRRLCQAMLRNAGWDEDMPSGLEALTETVSRFAAEEGGPKCGFLYEMVTRRAYGDAEEDTCRFTVRREDCGLWSALFAFESGTPFQPEDWLRLHVQSGKVPMLALRACDDFDRDKGLLAFSGGYLQEDWRRMEECWLWLVTRYGEQEPDETIRRLNRLARLLADEEEDLTVGGLLRRCGEMLQRLHDRAADAEGLRGALETALQNRDYQTLFALQCAVAQSALWEAGRAEYWRQCLGRLAEVFPA